MPNGIDVGDAAGDLSSAKAEAAQTLADAQATGSASPGLSFEPFKPTPAGSPAKKAARSPLRPPNPADTVVSADNTPDTGVHADFNQAPPPPKPAQTVAPKPGFWDNSSSEIGNGIMRGLAGG